MGYHVQLFEGTDAVVYVGRLRRGRAVWETGTYYPHPSNAKKAAFGWLNQKYVGVRRAEIWDLMGLVLETHQRERSADGRVITKSWNHRPLSPGRSHFL